MVKIRKGLLTTLFISGYMPYLAFFQNDLVVTLIFFCLMIL